MKRVLLSLLLLAVLPMTSMAQVEREESGAVKVYFRQGKAFIDEQYKDNGSSLEKFAKEILSYQSDSTANIGKVRIVSSTSPEGGKQINDRIAIERAKAISDWLGVKTLKKIEVVVESMNTDWDTLIRFVESNEDVPYKSEVLDVLYNTPEFKDKNGVVVNERYDKLFSLRHSIPYVWMYKNIFPDMRYASASVVVMWGAAPKLIITTKSPMNFAYTGSDDVITFTKEKSTDNVIPTANTDADWIEAINPTREGIYFSVAKNPVQEPRSAIINVEYYGQNYPVVINQEAAPALKQEEALSSTPDCKPFYMAVKTNMLYDVALVPNIGVEFYLGKQWSVVANWHYAWWKTDTYEKYWRTYGGDVAVRKWFGKQAKQAPLSGHHVGLYGQMITYDLLLGDNGILADRWSYSSGLEYGYSLPVARRLNIDFTLGAGYHWGEFKEYVPIDGHYVWKATKERKYIGPTKVEVSLAWLIGCKNYNKNKGGKR